MQINAIYRDYEEKHFRDFSEMVFCLYGEDPEGEAISEEKIRRTVRESMERPEKLRIVLICAGGEDEAGDAAVTTGANAAVVGYSILVFYWSNEYGGDIVNIDELYIKKEFRKGGIASNFIKCQMGAYKNTRAIAIETTPSNEAAASLYKKLGFKASPNDHMILPL